MAFVVLNTSYVFVIQKSDEERMLTAQGDICDEIPLHPYVQVIAGKWVSGTVASKPAQHP